MQSEIKLNEELESVQIAPTNRERVCRVCHKNTSKYTCPKCNLPYCSAQCYKNHNDGCTNEFWKENVMSELQSQKASDEEKQKFAKMLTENYEKMNLSEEQAQKLDSQEEDVTPSQIIDVEEELSKMNISKEDIKDLNEEQIQGFIEWIKSGRVSEYIQPWRPWWSDDAIMMGTTRENVSIEDEIRKSSDIPPLIQVPPFHSLSRSKPSKLLFFNLIDLLYTYAFVMRCVNGEPEEMDSRDVADDVLGVSTVLSSTDNHESASVAIHSVVESAVRVNNAPGAGVMRIEAVRDTSSLLDNGRYITAALSHLASIIDRAHQDETNRDRAYKKKMFVTVKKVQFYLSWTVSRVEEREEGEFHFLSEKMKQVYEEYKRT
ncbi:hypothetical protein PROFUN_10328 [Planoprotostelium fungivorum]|uniref:HIT-type domain-containing protein n=1 Tax=Planoprotostelium fungivorum TaxID=1890364 RepID=A0A2P6NDU7_9EUKA|nr:hypothetical protein PROFUN_10328 [Planoprotostelium fungivorum]